MGKDIQTWNELTAEVSRLERENERLRGGDGCEMCKDEDSIKGYVIIPRYETNIISDYCPYCGRKLGE